MTPTPESYFQQGQDILSGEPAVQEQGEQPVEATLRQQLAHEQAARREAERQRRALFELFMQAPAMLAQLRGPEHIFEFANEMFLQFVERDAREIIGRAARDVFPELEPQGFFALLDQVYHTGEPFTGKEMQMRLYLADKSASKAGYFRFAYQPTRNAAGEVDGVLIHALEVTEQVQARRELQSQQRRLVLAQRVADIGTFEWDIVQNHIYWTPELEALYGLPAGAFEGTYEHWTRRIHPEDLPHTEENLQAVLNEGAPFHVEFRVVWPDASEHWLLARGEVSSYDSRGRPLKMIGVNIDITARKATEQQMAAMNQRLEDLNANLEAIVEQRTKALNETNKELQRSNQELQDFAYVASHDLQEPLRKIQAFGNLLEEEYRPALGEDGKMYLDRMRIAASRMQKLIVDLLTFSRVTTKAQPFVEVDLSVLVQQVLDDLEARLKETQGSVEVGPLPTIEADALQMQQMFQNLLSNALKFHRPEEPPRVRISAEYPVAPESNLLPAGEYCRLLVEDNGIGFDEKYLDRIFTVFQRLHGKGKYEGTGIGLAVVRKIVERHGGTVTAKSALGEGSTFIITLPLRHSTEGEKSDAE